MLELHLSTPWSVRNTSFRSSDNSVQYFIETPYCWGIRTSRVIRWNGPIRELVATIDWKWVGVPDVHFVNVRDEGCQDVSVEDESTVRFLRRGRYDKLSCHIMKCSDGREYEWRSTLTPELFPIREDHHQKEAEAELRPNAIAVYKHANWIKGRKPRLLVDECAMSILDQVVVSFIVVENMRMERH